jgi:hypothetical protein
MTAPFESDEDKRAKKPEAKTESSNVGYYAAALIGIAAIAGISAYYLKNKK